MADLSALGAWSRGEAPGRGHATEVGEARAELLLRWSRHPWDFLTGVDTTDGPPRPILWTKDEASAEAIRPFPADKLYLRHYLDLLLEDPRQNPASKLILVDKSRQMMMSTATCLFMLWLILFRDARRLILSKSTEDEAKEMLEDKVRFPWSQLPAWARKAMPLSPKPAGRVRARKRASYILGVAENVAEREARGGTASFVDIDEAARQMTFEAMLGAIAPMASKAVALTTASFDGLGGKTFKRLLDEAKQAGRLEPPPEGIPGFQGTRVAGVRDFTVLELDYIADPAKRDPIWADVQRRGMPNHNAWRREYCRDWTSASGTPFYPEFALRPEVYKRSAPGLISGLPVIRGWDFGFRRPACVWMQYSPKSGRLWVLRELMPSNIDTYSFRDLVQFVSGERDLDDLTKRPKAMEWLRVLQNADAPPPPWFGPGTRFVDYSGPEALRIAASVEGDSSARTDAAILEAEGIYLASYSMTVEARENIIRKLLLIRPDGTPSMYFDEAGCPELCKGMAGGIGYPEGSKLNPNPTQPRKEGYFEHLHDALGYALVNVVPVSDLERAVAATSGSLLPGEAPKKKPPVASDDQGLWCNEVHDSFWQ